MTARLNRGAWDTPYGSHWTRFCRSSGVQFSQTKSSPSIAAPMDREDGISNTPGEAMEMDMHRSQVARDQDPAIFRRDPQHFRIESGIRNCTRSRPEVYRRLSPEQSFPYVLIDVSVGLKADLQASVAAASFLARSKRSIIS